MGHLLLALTSVVGMLVLGLAHAGRLSAYGLSRSSQQAGQVTNLNTVSDSKQLEPLLERLSLNAADRGFAAQNLFRFIRDLREAGDTLPNVGAILGARVTADAIDRAPLTEYKERLQKRARPRFTDRATCTHRSATFYRSGSGSPKTVIGSSDRRNVRQGDIVLECLVFHFVLGCGAALAVEQLPRRLFLLAAAHLLTAIGFAVLLSRPDPLRDTLLFARYTQGLMLGLAVFGLVSLIDFRKAAFLTLSYVPLVGALLLSSVLIVFGDGPGNSNVKVNLGPVQPVEAIRLLLALFLAGYFARRWELLRQIDSPTIRDYRLPGWFHFPRLDYLLPVLAGVAVALIFFFLQKDLGPALFISCVFLAVYTIARNRVGMAVTGLLFLLLGFSLGYLLNVSSTLAARVQMWLSPWDNSVRGGDQIAQSFWGLSTGGLFGTGLGLGDTRFLPAGHTDLVLASIGEELGFIGLCLIGAVYAVIAAHGFRIARGAANDYGFFLATTVTLFLIAPALIMVAGSLGIIPLTGVVTPFLSYGGSAMLANFAALGILTAIRKDKRSRPLAAQTATTEPFLKPLRYLERGLAVAAVALLAILFNVQVHFRR